MTGPVLGKHDPVYHNPHMSYSIPVPLEFWKVCALERADGTLSVTGFVLGQQDITSLPGFEEKFDVIAAQVTLADLEHRTGLSFGALKQHDHFAAGGAPGTLEIHRPEGRQKVRTLTTLARIEHRTGLSFAALKQHDHFAAGGAPGTLEIDRPEGRQKIRPLSTFEDI